MRAATGWLALLGLAACSTDFERQSQIARVRVLAVRSEPAELLIPFTLDGPAPAVQLEALAVAPEDRPVSVRLAFCRPFVNVYAADFECPGKDGVELVDGGLSLLDPRVLALFTGPDGGQGGNPLADPLVVSQLGAGIPLQVGYEATDGTAGAAGVERGFATVVARQTLSPNHNPTILDVEVGGVSLQGRHLDAGVDVVLEPRLGPGALEVYALDGGTLQEGLSLSWFASGGAAISDFRSAVLPGDAGVATTTLTTPDAGGATTVWVVARDGRGGTGWLVRRFTSSR
jgi:hypothetical protein